MSNNKRVITKDLLKPIFPTKKPKKKKPASKKQISKDPYNTDPSKPLKKPKKPKMNPKLKKLILETMKKNNITI